MIEAAVIAAAVIVAAVIAAAVIEAAVIVAAVGQTECHNIRHVSPHPLGHRIPLSIQPP